MKDDLEQYVADQGAEFSQLVDNCALWHQQYQDIPGRATLLTPVQLTVSTNDSALVGFEMDRDNDHLFIDLKREDVARLHAQLGAWLGGAQ